MRIRTVIATLATLSAILNANAGTLANGKWTAPGCGTIPAAPAVDASGVDAYNRSLKQIREWQPQAQAYIDCIVKEANADNAIIVKFANAEQERFRDEVAKIKTTADDAKTKLDGK
ncbi:hypothetical protein F6R98_19615 [Candidatus Methylospira mobilis]|uniref:Uncharacterized protein n=1 Tax=Candidatus Methylospira mobilis TaxID=1808979 RepID=A0A5Q0BQI0_9GAMM|nr:hypothetical protein [Candidatus Methylospira mobilis]QFY44561.1 hypothetical protein F6R98_19615 [Candidatus Methylospira mobilis]WNV06004.1 hypothetical protein RP726_06200 [Candidatus Methylospira mobilis]